jgi:hypothetical protein
MGCGASGDIAARSAETEIIPPPTAEEIRLHREVDAMGFYSDAESTEEPGPISRAMLLKARVLLARVHGIDDDPDQFHDEVMACVPVYLAADYNFIRTWQEETWIATREDTPGLASSARASECGGELSSLSASFTYSTRAAVAAAVASPFSTPKRKPSVLSPYRTRGYALDPTASEPDLYGFQLPASCVAAFPASSGQQGSALDVAMPPSPGLKRGPKTYRASAFNVSDCSHCTMTPEMGDAGEGRRRRSSISSSATLKSTVSSRTVPGGWGTLPALLPGAVPCDAF